MVSKFRIRFQKAGDLRFLSHHDLMRLFERMLRRAGLPFRSTEGFHPKPKMAFASALALGIIGHEEVVEIEFDGELDEEEVRNRLQAQAPTGLGITLARRIDPKTRAHACRVQYRVPLDRGRTDELNERVGQLLEQPQCWVQRDRPHPRPVDIKPFLLRFFINDDSLTMELKVTPQGTARPEEILRLLGLEDLLLAGTVLERTKLELEDELPHGGEDSNPIVFAGGGGERELALLQADAEEAAVEPLTAAE